MNSLTINDFLPYPNVVREWVLQKDFYNAKQFSQKIGSYTSWPGMRTDHVMDLDLNYANEVLSKVSTVSRKIFYDAPVSIRSYFQLCSEDDGDSWIHQDNNVDLAAVLYLTPNPPPNSGTTLYDCKDIKKWQSLSIDDMMKINRQERQDLYDSLFTPVDAIGNVFNRLVMYRGDIFHKSNDYFGKTKYDSRLIQVFFISYEK